SSIRSMSTGEGAHARAKYNLHTGYREGVGGVVYPSIGSLVAQQIGNLEAALPNYVSIGNRSYGAGFIGPRYEPLTIGDPSRGVENLRATVGTDQFDSRVGLLDAMEQSFHSSHNAPVAEAHQTTY